MAVSKMEVNKVVPSNSSSSIDSPRCPQKREAGLQLSLIPGYGERPSGPSRTPSVALPRRFHRSQRAGSLSGQVYHWRQQRLLVVHRRQDTPAVLQLSFLSFQEPAVVEDQLLAGHFGGQRQDDETDSQVPEAVQPELPEGERADSDRQR